MKTNSVDKDFSLPPYWTVDIAQRLWWFFTKPLFLFFLHFKVNGKENLYSLPNGIIFASNHLSELDGELISESFDLFSKRIPFFYVTRERSYYSDGFIETFVFNRVVLHLSGAYPAIVGINDYEKSLASHIELLKKKKNVVIFPEGKRTRDGFFLPAKGGVIALVKHSGAPVVPVAISGVLKITLKDFLLRKRFVKISFGKPIFPVELFAGYENAEPQDYKKIAEERIMKKIKELLD